MTVLIIGAGLVGSQVAKILADAGERPLLSLIEHLQGQGSRERLQRTFVRDASPQGDRVRYIDWPEPDVPFENVGTPTWDGLPLDRYLSLLDMLNPMHRLWSDGRWNKLTVAHGAKARKSTPLKGKRRAWVGAT